MGNKIPYDKENPVKIPVSELMKLIGDNCDYKFCIIDETNDEELMTLAANHGINLRGYKPTAITKRHEAKVLVYEKQIGLDYYYVEEIRTGKKSLAFHTLYKRKTKNRKNNPLKPPQSC